MATSARCEAPRVPMRVMLLDPHAVLRDGLRAYLSALADIEVVEDAADGRQALDRLADLDADGHLPDIILMGLQLPGLDGLTAIAAIRARYPSVAVVVLTACNEGATVRAALRLGISGYVLKVRPAVEVATALRTAYAGAVHLDVAVVTHVMHAPQPLVVHALTDALSPRQRDVLTLVAQGRSTREIARRLGIREHTVRTHVSHILHALKLTSRTQAALYAAHAQELAG